MAVVSNGLEKLGFKKVRRRVGSKKESEQEKVSLPTSSEFYCPKILLIIILFCLVLCSTAFAGWVNDGLGKDEDWTNNPTTLSANWSSVPNCFEYQYAIGTTPGGTDVVNWTLVPGQGSLTYVTHTGLQLVHGVAYYFTVRANTAIGMIDVGTSDGITVDLIPPESAVNPLPAEQTSPVFEVSWSGTDDGSGILVYDIQVKDGTDGKWTDWRIAVTYTSDVFTGDYNHTYFFRSRARDYAGNVGQYPEVPDAQTTIIKPSIAWVKDGLAEDETWTRKTNELSANWAPTPGTYGYEYAIGTAPGATDVVSWTLSGGQGTQTYVTRTGLSLQYGATYYFTVRAQLYKGYTDPVSSNGITVDNVPPSSSVSPLPPYQSSPSFTVSWSGQDWVSGIKHYDVQYSIDGGDWQNWKAGTTSTSDVFPGQFGHTYYFRCRAVDNAGNEESYPSQADTYTSIVTGEIAWVNDGLGDDEDWTNKPDELSANWASVSGAEGYQYSIWRVSDGACIVDWEYPAKPSDRSVTRQSLNLQNGQKYYFSVRVVWDLKQGLYGLPCNSDGITVDLEPPASRVEALPAEVPTEEFEVRWSGEDHLSGIKEYDIQVRDGEGGAWQDWVLATGATSGWYSGVDGHTYYFRSRARDVAGNQEAYPSEPDAYTTVRLPEIPVVAWVRDGLGGDEDWTNNTGSLSANWAEAAGVDGYEYAIGTVEGGSDVVSWRAPGDPKATWVTHSGLSLLHGVKYYFSVRCVVGDRRGGSKSSDGITVDTVAPISRVKDLPEEVTSLTFEVSWSGSDGLSGIKDYDVQYKDGSGSWADWVLATVDTVKEFSGEDGHTYYFRSRARDVAGNEEAYPSEPDAYTTVRLAPPPPPPPPARDVTLSITSAPSALVFHSGENSKTITYTISLTGPRGVSIQREEVILEQEGDTLRIETPIISQSLAAGTSIRLERTVQIDDGLKNLILSGRPQATCRLRRKFSGFDERSNPISGESIIEIEVRTSPAEGFDITDLAIVVPRGPFVQGEDVQASVRFSAAGGPGRVEGNIYIDGTGWRSFIVDNIGDGDEIATPPLPTSEAGTHRLKVVLTAPESLEDSTSYEVAVAESAGLFERLTTLNVLKERDSPWAILSDIHATATRLESPSEPEQERYRLNGTGKLRIDPLNNRIVDVRINELLIAFNSSDPPNSRIISGVIETPPVTPPASLFSIYYDFLSVTSVRYQGGWDHLEIDANLNLPLINQTLYELSGITVRSDGIQGKTFDDEHSFDLCGLEFRLQTVTIDRTTHPPIEIGYSGGSVFASLSGTMSLLRGGRRETITSFTGFRFAVNVRNGAVDVSGNFSLSDPFRFIPGNDYFNLTRLTFVVAGSDFGFEAEADVNLPEPLNRFGRQRATFRIDRNGDVAAAITLIDEPSSDRRSEPEPITGSGSDPTQFSFWVCQFDLTYLGIDLALRGGNLNKSLSKVKVGADLWVKERDDRWLRQELGTSRFPCFTIDFDGNTNWSLPTEIAVIRDRKIDLGAVWIQIRSLDIVPTPFALVLSAGLGIDVDAVRSSVAVDGFRVDIDGNINWGTLREGEFEVLDVIRIAVESIEFSTSPTTITFETDGSDGSSHQTREESISVSQYFRITNAEINLQASAVTFSGGFDELLIYEKPGGRTSFVLRDVEIDLCGFNLAGSFEYRNPVVAVAGSIEGAGFPIRVVGKVGSVDGDLTFGLFATVGIPPTTIVPPAFLVLVEVGGGFFFNPEQRDIEEIRSLCGVDHSELSRRAGSGNIPPDLPTPQPGKFAVLLYGGFYCLNDHLVTGQALLTLSNNYFMLDAHAEIFPDEGPIATGALHLCISWAPAFAEGGVWVDVDIIDIVTGTGYFEFYVFPRRDEVVWAIMGGANLEVISIIDIGAEFFVGPPGFMISGNLEVGIDLYVISGGFRLELMVWYETIPPGETWGAYAKGEVWGDFLAGLFSASASLEGALIFDPLPEVITGATLRISAIWCLVKWSGSIWIAIGAYGIDAGTGRNSKLDQALEDARSMADQMSREIDEIKDAIDSVAAALGSLDPKTREILGVQLVGLESRRILPSFYWEETTGLPSLRQPEACTWLLNNVLSDSRLQDLWRIRAQRNVAFDGYKSLVNAISPVQEAVQRRLDEALPELEALPTVGEISIRNPVRGMQYETVEGRTIKAGYDLDQDAASEASRAMAENKQSQQAYIRSVIAQTEELRRLVAKTDDLLYGWSPLSERRTGGGGRGGLSIGIVPIVHLSNFATLMNLANMYASSLDSLNKYYLKYFEFLELAYTHSVAKSAEVRAKQGELQSAIESQADELRRASLDNLKKLTRNRRAMLLSLYNEAIERMTSEGTDPRTLPAEDQPQPPIAIDEAWTPDQWRTACVNFGMELWYHLPLAGYLKSSSSISLLPVRKDILERNTSLVNAWSDFTTRLDLVFERRTRLYELLYDLYDELSTVYGAYPLPVREDTVDVPSLRAISFKEVLFVNPNYRSEGGRGEGPRGSSGGGFGLGFTPEATRSRTEIVGTDIQRYLVPGAMLAPGIRLPTMGSYYGSEKRKVFDLLLPPELTLFEGQCRGIDSRAGSYARLDCRFDARHPVGVVEYGVKIWQPDFLTDWEREIGVMSSDWFSLGSQKKDFTMLFVPGGAPHGEGRKLFVRARGPAGNYTYRQANFQISYTGGYVSTLDTSDPTPPSRPIVDDYPQTAESEAGGHAGQWTRDRTTLYGRWKSQDNESGVSEYQYRVITEGKTMSGGRLVIVPVAVIDWRSAGMMEELNIRDLRLENNTTYYIEVKARNGAGLWSAVGRSDGIKTDFEPPRVTSLTLRQGSPPSSSGGSGGSGGLGGFLPPIPPVDPSSIPETALRYFPNSLFAEFSGLDNESGIADYDFVVTDEAGNQLRSGRTTLNRLYIQDLPLRSGATYRITIRAKDNVGWVSEPQSSTTTIQFRDTTPPPSPSMRYVYPTPLPSSCTYVNPWLYIYSNSQIKVAWSDVFDSESGIYEYRIAIGTSPDRTDVLPWTSIGKVNQYENTSLRLENGRSYYILLKTVNGAGLESQTRLGPLKVEVTPPSAPSIRFLGGARITVTSTDSETPVRLYRFFTYNERGERRYDSGWILVPAPSNSVTVEFDIYTDDMRRRHIPEPERGWTVGVITRNDAGWQSEETRYVLGTGFEIQRQPIAPPPPPRGR